MNTLESDRMTALGPNDFSLIYASKYLRYFKDMLYIFPIYGWDRAEKCLIYPWDISEISMRIVRTKH